MAPLRIPETEAGMTLSCYVRGRLVRAMNVMLHIKCNNSTIHLPNPRLTDVANP